MTTHSTTLSPYLPGEGVLILMATSAVMPLTFPAGWHVIFNHSTVALPTNFTLAAIWRVMDGTEGATVDILSPGTGQLTFQAFTFADFDPYTAPQASTDITAGASDNPPLLTTSWGSRKVTWVSVDFGPDDTHTVSAAPANYNGLFGFLSGQTQYVLAGVRELEAASENPGAFTGAIASSATATIGILGFCADLADAEPAGRSLPVDMALEDEPLQDGWQSSVYADEQILNDDITNRCVPNDMASEDEPDAFGWQSAPLHDTPFNGDICGTSQLILSVDNDEEGFDGFFASPLHDTPVVVEPPAPETATGTLPGVMGRKKWWLEHASRSEKARKVREGIRWPALPEPKKVPPFNPIVVTNRTVRPRLAQINRDWKIKQRKVRAADDAIIAAIIASILMESDDESG